MDAVSASRELAYESEREEILREAAQKLAQNEKKHAREHGREKGLHGAVADTDWTYKQHGSPEERDQAMIELGMRLS